MAENEWITNPTSWLSRSLWPTEQKKNEPSLRIDFGYHLEEWKTNYNAVILFVSHSGIFYSYHIIHFIKRTKIFLIHLILDFLICNWWGSVKMVSKHTWPHNTTYLIFSATFFFVFFYFFSSSVSRKLFIKWLFSLIFERRLPFADFNCIHAKFAITYYCRCLFRCFFFFCVCV